MEIEKYIVATDGSLVDMSLAGDSVAFEHLFTRYRHSILQLYTSRTGSREDALDLLQEIFVKVYLNLHKYDRRYTFGQWVFTISRNTFIDYIRRRRDSISIDENTPAGITPAWHGPTPEESIIRSQQWDQIQAYLSGMDSRYRRLIELRFFKDYSYDEIAAELNLPLGTVKTQIHRARTQLCRFITENTDILL